MTADARTIEAYSQRVSDYQEMVDSPSDYRNLQKFIDSLPDGARVFDIGAGPGHDALRMTKAGLNVTALEPTPEFADLIEKHGIRVQRKTFSGINEINYFDGAWASFSLLHARRTDLPNHLNQIAVALKPGGQFVLGMKTGSGETRDRFGRFYCYYAKHELIGLLQDAGFIFQDSKEGSARGLAGDREPYVIINAELNLPGE